MLYRVWRDPSLAPDVAADDDGAKPKVSARSRCCASCPARFVFFMVMGLIMFGVATPTEAAATGVFGAVIVALIYRKFSWQMMAAFTTAATVSALLLVIMCCAVMFSQLLTFTGATRAVAELVAALDAPAIIMLLAMLALPFVLFMFLDQLALMLVLIPIYQPLIKHYAFDPIWFWTLFLIVATVGGLTPPFGYVLFALKSAAPATVDDGNLPRVLAVRLAHHAGIDHPDSGSEPGDLPAQPDQAGVAKAPREFEDVESCCRIRGCQ